MERKVFVVETIVGLILWKKEIKGLLNFGQKRNSGITTNTGIRDKCLIASQSDLT